MVAKFLDGTALASSADNISDDQSSVTLMTAHLAKGLNSPDCIRGRHE